MPGFSKARLDHFAAIRPQAEYCGVCVRTCVRTYGKESGSAMCKVCCEYPHKERPTHVKKIFHIVSNLINNL